MPSQESQGILSPLLKTARYRHAAKYIEPHAKVLDVGCGAGNFRQHLPSSVTYHGVDINRHWPPDTPNMFVADVTKNTPYAIRHNRYDHIVALALIEHLKNPVMFLKNIAKLLEPDGHIIITTPHPHARRLHETGAKIGLFSLEAAAQHHQFYDRQEIIKLSNQAGLICSHTEAFELSINQLFILTR